MAVPIPSYKEIVGLVKTGLTIEAQEKIMELRVAALEIQEENLQLRAKIGELEGQLSQSKDLRFDTNMYWRIDATGKRDGPFCAVCYDRDKKVVHLHFNRNRGEMPWLCHVCESSFGPV